MEKSEKKSLREGVTSNNQSIRLMDTGLPQNSADFYRRGKSRVFQVPDGFTFSQWAKIRGYNITPVWSLNRLIEVYHICVQRKNKVYLDMDGDLLETMVKAIEVHHERGKVNYDKLEDYLCEKQ